MVKSKKPPQPIPAVSVQIMLSVINQYPELQQRVQYEQQVVQQKKLVDILLSVISQYPQLMEQVGYQHQLLQQRQQYYPQGGWQSGNEVQGTITTDTNGQQQSYREVVYAQPLRVVYAQYPNQGTQLYSANTAQVASPQRANPVDPTREEPVYTGGEARGTEH
jgi:hypothetical protein